MTSTPERPFFYYIHSHRLAAEMWTTMKLRCSFYLYRFCIYMSYGFPIIHFCNPGVYYETPYINWGPVWPSLLPKSKLCHTVSPYHTFVSFHILFNALFTSLRSTVPCKRNELVAELISHTSLQHTCQMAVNFASLFYEELVTDIV